MDSSELIASLKSFLSKFEGNVTWMYLDQKGLVHTGIGFNIDAPSLAGKLPWMRNLLRSPFTPGHPLVTCGWEPSVPCSPMPESPRLLAPSPLLRAGNATADEIDTEWRTIRSLQHLKGAGANAFHPYANLHVSSDAVDSKFREEVHIRIRQLRAIFPSFESFPAEARKAMLVHAWANDPSSLERRWPAYVAACRARRWVLGRPDPERRDPKRQDAATQSHWLGMRKERYEGMVAMFANAQAAEKTAR